MFIAVEGSNGSGKGTLITSIKVELEKMGHKVTLTREPGGTEIGEKLRGKVLSSEITPEMELLLFSASRALNIIDVIEPALKKGDIVITDRFDDSTRAFQHYARGLPKDKVEDSISASLNGVKPDLYILLDIPAEDGLKRTHKRGSNELDNFEKESLKFLEKARMGFISAVSEKDNYIIIDAKLDKDDILNQALEKIKTIIKEKND